MRSYIIIFERIYLINYVILHTYISAYMHISAYGRILYRRCIWSAFRVLRPFTIIFGLSLIKYIELKASECIKLYQLQYVIKLIIVIYT